MNRYGYIRVAHIHERVSTRSFVVLIRGNSKSNHLGAQGTFSPNPLSSFFSFVKVLIVFVAGAEGTTGLEGFGLTRKPFAAGIERFFSFLGVL